MDIRINSGEGDVAGKRIPPESQALRDVISFVERKPFVRRIIGINSPDLTRDQVKCAIVAFVRKVREEGS